MKATRCALWGRSPLRRSVLAASVPVRLRALSFFLLGWRLEVAA